MGVEFGPETISDVTAALRAHLPAWHLPATASLTLLNVSENATYRADHAGGSVVIRVHRSRYHEADEITSEISWIEALRRDAIVETPAPLAARDGAFVQTLLSPTGQRARRAVAFAFAPGREPVPGEDLAGWFSRLGALTARMHHHAREWVPSPGFRRKTWDFDAMFGAAPFWGRWQAGLGLDAAGTALLARAINLIARRLERFGRSRERFGLIHADLRLANLLVDGDDLRVIDFDDCGFSWRLYDFATAVSFFEHEPVVEDLRAAWVAGYRTVTALSKEDEDELPVFVAMRRFLLVAWIASHQDVPIAQELGAGYTFGALDMAERLLSSYNETKEP